jgi:TEA/ATTS domain
MHFGILLPPNPLFNPPSARFDIFHLYPCAWPPFILLSLSLLWPCRALQSPLPVVQDPPLLPPVKELSPLSENIERCSRTVPVRYGRRASRKSSWTVRSSFHFSPLSYLDHCLQSGLRQYWESPWATYSRGRSRWRNQFLVDYLKEAGIDRSKKQVASHIQVLRNMWKGEKGVFRSH